MIERMVKGPRPNTAAPVLLLALLAAFGAALADASAASSRNGRIAFISIVPSDTDTVGTLNTIPPTGGRATERSAYDSLSPAWSPDGRRMALHRSGSGVFVRDPWHRRTGKLVAPDGDDPTWSPTGRRLAYTKNEGVGLDDYDTFAIHVVGATGRQRRRLGPGQDPAWSSRNRIAFIGIRDKSLYTMRPDGSGRRHIARNARQPSWSPDGRRIAFVRQDEIYVVSAAGGTPRRLVEGEEPVWSPDRTLIAFTASRKGACEDSVWTIRPDGSQKRRLTTAAFDDCIFDLAWQPLPR